MKGLNFLPQPYISKILLEKGNVEPFDHKGFVNLYWDDTDTEENKSPTDKKIKITFDVAFKSISMGSLSETSSAYQKLLKTLQNSVAFGFRITSEQVLKNFIEAKNKAEFFMSIGAPEPVIGLTVPFPLIKNLKDYTYYDGNSYVVNIPFQASDTYAYTQTAAEGNPGFLAYVFWATYDGEMSNPSQSTSNLFASEIIFRQGALVADTTYFRIQDVYMKGNDNFSMIGDDHQTKAVRANYGSPGDIWCGPVHRHGDHFMAGMSHSLHAHPYLRIYVLESDKIVDMRTAGLLEDMFAYNSTENTDMLAITTSPTYTNFKANSLVDNLNEHKAITTEVGYSVRRLTGHEDYGLLGTGAKDKVNLFFGIDIGRLLKNTTMAPGLLDRLISMRSSFLQDFIKQVEFIRFDISRLNVATGEKKVLLSTNNAKFFNDAKSKDPQGTSLERIDNLSINNDDKTIAFYEFRDGELDTTTYNNQTFKYSIKLQFRDPLLVFINRALQQTQKILKDLDELLLKLSLKVCDPKTLKRSAGFNRFYKKINPAFLEHALYPTESTRILTFDFSPLGWPQSLQDGFQGPGLGEGSLALLLISMGGKFDELRPLDEYPSGFAGALTLAALAKNILHSVRLSSTSPTLIQNARNLFGLLEDKLVSFLSIYNGAVVSKTEGSGFAYETYIKNQGQTDTKSDATVVTYEETFAKALDLNKTKNKFDWTAVLGASQAKPDGSGYYNHKLIYRDAYKAAIEEPLKYLLRPHPWTVGTPFEEIELELLSTEAAYSFLPYYTMNAQTIDPNKPPTLAIYQTQPLGSRYTFNLFNYENFKGVPANTLATPTQWTEDFEGKAYQVMRKKLFDRHTNKPKNITIPELLTYFGVKLPAKSTLDVGALELLLDSALTEQSDIGQPTSPSADNFGNPTLPVVEVPSPTGKVVGQIDVESGGATDNPDYAWGGGALKYYDVDVAKKLINLVFSDNTHNFRHLKLFMPNNPWFIDHKKDSETTNASGNSLLDNQSPAPIQILSLAAWNSYPSDGPDQEGFQTGHGELTLKEINTTFFRQIFKQTTEAGSIQALRLENYYLYILFLCLFGKVHYLRGFTQANSSAGQSKMTPSTYYFRNQVKAYDWAPLTKAVLDSMQAGKLLYCCIRLNDDGHLIDDEYVQLFLDYFNNNQYFYLTTDIMPPG